jgi:predicted phosphodiesterase
MPQESTAKVTPQKMSHGEKYDERKHKHRKRGHKRHHPGKATKKTTSVKKVAASAALTQGEETSGKRGSLLSNGIACAEHGVWTDVTQVKSPPANQRPLQFSGVDPEENERILVSGKMSFAIVGCSGDPTTGANTQAVADAVSQDKDLSFLYHLGDIIYTRSGSDAEGGGSAKPYSHSLWDTQFFGPYARFPKKIFSIAGNHDGKYKEKIMALRDYVSFFCADAEQLPHGRKHRRKMTQPYIYWRLDTPYAYFIGLYSNIANGGILDKPSQYTKVNFTDGPQYRWLVKQLRDVAAMNRTAREHRKAVLLTVHYPPYSGATNFNVRGDPSKGGAATKGKHPAQPNNYDAPYLGKVLQQAFKDGGQRPDAIFSAHAHLFERLNYKFSDGAVMPCLIAGCGGHSPLERLFDACDGTSQRSRKPTFAAVKPGSFGFPKGDRVKVKYFDDGKEGGHFGYVKVTIQSKKRSLTCKFMGVTDGRAEKLDKHTILV